MLKLLFICYNFFMALDLTAEQILADKLIEDWFSHSTSQTFVLAGYAGTGKTTLLKHAVCETLKLVPDQSAAFVTPTGKAATVLIRSGIAATTLHRLIYQSIAEEQQIEINGKKITVEKLTFKRRETIDKSIKLIVLDEASMVSDEVLFDLTEFGVKILLCGDNAQLPPVEGFNGFLQSPDFTLKTIVRQQMGNPIIRLAEMAREGKYIPYGNYGGKALVMSNRYFKGEKRRLSLLNASQIICGINKTRAQINEEVRGYLGFDSLPQSGEKLICTQNNWETYIDGDMRFNMVNGIIGTAVDPFYDLQKSIGFMQFKPDFLDELCPRRCLLTRGYLPTDTTVTSAEIILKGLTRTANRLARSL